MDTAYEPNENGNNLKIALIQKREEFSDSPLPRMYDTELIQHNNSHSEVVNIFKVIKRYFLSISGRYFALDNSKWIHSKCLAQQLIIKLRYL